MKNSCTQTFIYLNLTTPKLKYKPYKKPSYMWLKRYTCSICNKRFSSSYSLDDIEHKICYSCDYTSEDLKWNASGVLDFNSLLISDP